MVVVVVEGRSTYDDADEISARWATRRTNMREATIGALLPMSDEYLGVEAASCYGQEKTCFVGDNRIGGASKKVSGIGVLELKKQDSNSKQALPRWQLGDSMSKAVR